MPLEWKLRTQLWDMQSAMVVLRLTFYLSHFHVRLLFFHVLHLSDINGWHNQQEPISHGHNCYIDNEDPCYSDEVAFPPISHGMNCHGNHISLQRQTSKIWRHVIRQLAETVQLQIYHKWLCISCMDLVSLIPVIQLAQIILLSDAHSAQHIGWAGEQFVYTTTLPTLLASTIELDWAQSAEAVLW